MHSFQGSDYTADLSIRQKLADAAFRKTFARLLKAKTGEDVLLEPEAIQEDLIMVDGRTSLVWRRLLPWELALIVIGILASLACCAAVGFFFWRHQQRAKQTELPAVVYYNNNGQGSK